MRPDVIVSARDPELVERLSRAARDVLDRLADPEGPAAVRVDGPRALATFPAGALAIVRVTRRSLRGLPRLVARLEAAGACGIQLVWDGVEPPRREAEAVVFAILERRRSGKDTRVCLAADERPLRLLRLPAPTA